MLVSRRAQLDAQPLQIVHCDVIKSLNCAQTDAAFLVACFEALTSSSLLQSIKLQFLSPYSSKTTKEYCNEEQN